MKLIYRSILLVLSLSLFSAQAFSAPKAYIDQELSGWAEPHLIVEGRHYSLNPWNGAYYASEGFASNELASEHIDLHITHARKAAWGIYGGLGAYLAIGLSADPEDTNLQLGALGVLIAGFIYGGYQSNLSRAHLFRAINTMNEANPVTVRQDVSLTFNF